MSKALKDAGLSALIALGIFGAMVGLPTVVGPGGKLSLDPQPWTVAMIVAVVFVAFQFHAARADALALQDAQKNKIRRVFH